MFYKKENSLSSLDSRRFYSAFSTISNNNLPFSYYIRIVFNFSLEDCSTEKKMETMVMQLIFFGNGLMGGISKVNFGQYGNG